MDTKETPFLAVGTSMKLNPQISLAFNGQCEAAFKWYEQALDGTIVSLFTWGQSPMAGEGPPGWDMKVMHATLKIGDTVIAGADMLPSQYEQPKGFSILLQMDDPVSAQRVFDAFAEHASIGMPLQETFWARRFAALVDQFGIPWSINCE